MKKMILLVTAATAIAVSALGLTESETRTALLKWMTGDRTITNPWVTVLEYVVDYCPSRVTTVTGLAALSTTRSDAATAVTPMIVDATTWYAGARYKFVANASTWSGYTTNVHINIDDGTGTGWTLDAPLVVGRGQDWDPPSLISNTSATITFTNFGTYPSPAVGDFCVASHTAIGLQDNVILSAIATNDAIRVTLYNNSGATIDAGTGQVRVLYWKFQ